MTHTQSLPPLIPSNRFMAPSVRNLVSGETDSTFVQLLRYTLVGGLAFLVDIGVLIILTEWAGWHYLASAAVGFGFGLATNYLLSIAWVFHKHTVKNRLTEFAIFGFLGIVGLGLNELTLLVFTGWLGIHYTVSKLIATALTFVWNFMSRKFLLFSPPEATASAPEAVDVIVEPVTAAETTCC
jgi:putative flippase GtrA